MGKVLAKEGGLLAHDQDGDAGLPEQQHAAGYQSGHPDESCYHGQQLECRGHGSLPALQQRGAEQRAQGGAGKRAKRGVEQPERTAGATMSESAANGLVGSLMFRNLQDA